VQPSAAGVECLGGLLGESYGQSAEKLQYLAEYTRAFALRAQVSGRQLAELLGHWTWACLGRRPGLSVFSSVFTFMDRFKGKKAPVWPSVRRELQTIAGLAPLLFTHLDAQHAETFLAVDASHWGAGVVASRMGSEEVRALLNSQVLDIKARMLTLPEQGHRLVAEAQWSVLLSRPWQQPEHINVLELRALVWAVRWFISLGRDSSMCRLGVLMDSSVVVGAVRKGRSSSFNLLCVLRKLSAYLLVSGLQLDLGWVRTDKNPSDDASRNKSETPKSNNQGAYVD
jgi:hypothetical protein